LLVTKNSLWKREKMKQETKNEASKQPVAVQPASMTAKAAVEAPKKTTVTGCVKLYDLDPEKTESVSRDVWTGSTLTQLEVNQ
jgi:hypothetical protein